MPLMHTASISGDRLQDIQRFGELFKPWAQFMLLRFLNESGDMEGAAELYYSRSSSIERRDDSLQGSNKERG